MKERLTLSVREQKRLLALNDVEKEKMGMRESAEALGVSERQEWRLLAAYKEEGAAGLAHRNRARKPVHTLGEEIQKQVVKVAHS